MQDQPGDLGQRLRLEVIRKPVREKLEEDHSQRIDIGPVIDHGRIRGDLLGAHVVGRANDLAGAGQAGARQQVGVNRAGHTEIEHLGLSSLFDHEFAGFKSRWMIPWSWACCTASQT